MYIGMYVLVVCECRSFTFRKSPWIATFAFPQSIMSATVTCVQQQKPHWSLVLRNHKEMSSSSSYFRLLNSHEKITSEEHSHNQQRILNFNSTARVGTLHFALQVSRRYFAKNTLRRYSPQHWSQLSWSYHSKLGLKNELNNFPTEKRPPALRVL